MREKLVNIYTRLSALFTHCEYTIYLIMQKVLIRIVGANQFLEYYTTLFIRVLLIPVDRSKLTNVQSLVKQYLIKNFDVVVGEMVSLSLMDVRQHNIL